MSNSEWLGPQREGPQRESGSIQALHAQAKRLAAYLPITLVRQILEGELPPPGTAVWLNAATLFSDISGFTGMAESLAPAGPRGAEELNRALLMTFTGLINAIHDAGGAVVHFHGDAMLVYFPDNDGRAAARALACATFMQRLMLTSLSQFSTQLLTSEPATFSLTIKIGVGYGRCLQTTIGHPQESLEFVLGGTAVDEAATAQQQAAAGEVIASQSVLAQAGLPTAAPFHTVDQISPVPHAREELHWHAYPAHALHRLLHTAPAFIPAPLVERLQHQTTRFIAEHRTITSLFVQFEGITFDAPDAGAKLQTYYEWARQVVARFGPRNGRVNRLLTGDKGSQLHILFGAPIAPDAPEQAIRCALALQREKPAFITHQQIGLAVGPVFATAVGSQNRREYTAVGRIVNLSAHLTLHCPPDQILVDDATANRVWEQFQFTPHTAANLKGQTEPMATYLAVQEQVNPTPFATRFARWQKTPPGREAETAQLRQRINTALHGHGGLLALSGPFGGGIRPLLADAARRWLDAGGRGFSSICQPHLADAPFAAWQTIWRDFLNLTPTMSPDEQAAHARHEIRNWLPGWADEVALWLSVLGLPVSARESSDESAVAPNVRQLWLFTLIQRCLAQAARQQPLLILMEDVQWADEASRELVAAVAAHAADLPLLMVVTFRPTPPFHFPALHQPATTHIILADWSAEQARAVARRRLGTGELPPLLEQRLGLKDANGRDTDQVNPLFLEESLKLMLAADVLQFPGTGHSRLQIDEARLSALPIPTTIAALLQTRLDALSAGAYSLLQMASVIGREFTLNLLMAVMPGMTAETALPLLAELAAADLVQTVTGAPQPVFMFQHILVQEVVYRSLPYARRQAVHLDIADWLVAQTSPAAPALYPLLAHHYGQAGAHEAGCQYALAAAREATALYANRAAAGYFQQAFNHLQAMGIAERVETAVAILTSQAEAYLRLGELEAAAKAVAAALDLGDGAEDRQATPTLLNVLAEIGLAQARYPEAAAVTRQVITRSGTMPPILAARAHQLAGQAATALRQWSLAEMELNTARTILKSNQLTRPLPELLAAFGELRCQQGAWPHAADLCLHAVDLAQQTGLPIPTAAALLSLAQVQLAQGRAREAAQTATEGVELARTTSPRLLAHLLIGRVDAWLYDGRFPEALADLQLAADVLAVMDDGLARLRLGLRWAVYCAGQADWEGSLGQLDRARGQLAVLHKTGGTAVLESVQLRLGLAQIALHTKQWEQAISLLAAAETEATTHQLVWLRPALAYWQGMVQMALGQAELAMHAFREGVTATPAGGCPDELPLLLLRLGQLTPPAHPRHWEYLEGCVTAVYDRARHTDKQFCLQEAGLLLLHAPDARLRRMGAACLAAI